MASLGDWCFRHRRIVVAVWLALLVGLVVADRAWGARYKTNVNLPDTGSARAHALLKREFPQAAGDSATVVWKALRGKVTDAAVRDRVQPMLRALDRVPHVAAVSDPYGPAIRRQISADGRIAYATVTFDAIGPKVPVSSITSVVTTARAAGNADVHVAVGGQIIQQTQQPQTRLSEAIGVTGAAVILFFAFGSLLAMLLPLGTALVALGAGLAAVGLLAHTFAVAAFAPQLATLIGLGVGVDYALFIVSRHRANLRRGMDVEASVVRSVDTSGRAVVFAGLTVCISLLGMFALGVSFLYGVAVSAALVVLATMLAATTLLPALLGFLGIRVLSRRARRDLAENGPHGEELSPRWWRWGRFVERHPAVLSAVAGLVAVVLVIPFFSLRLGSSDQGNDAPETTTRQAYDLLAEGFGPGFNGPLTLAAELRRPGDLAAVQEVARAVAATPGVVGVSAPITAPSGKAAVITVFPATSPQSEQTAALLTRLRERVIPAATAASGVPVYVGGITAVFADFAAVLGAKLPYFVGIVVLLASLLLAAVFRSLVIPLTASVMNLLATGASFGVVVAIFQWGWGGPLGIHSVGPIEAFLPVMMFAILFGLSMDYEVFLVSRMHEDWLGSHDNSDAVTRGQAETGPVITAAAMIMVLVFVSFVFGGERVIQEFGVGLAAAVLLDALVVRTVLVPAVMHVFGRSNWWLPGWLDRILPSVSVEGHLHEDALPPLPEEVRGG